MRIKPNVEVIKKGNYFYYAEERGSDNKAIYRADVIIRNNKYVIIGEGARKYRQNIIEAVKLYKSKYE